MALLSAYTHLSQTFVCPKERIKHKSVIKKFKLLLRPILTLVSLDPTGGELESVFSGSGESRVCMSFQVPVPGFSNIRIIP